MSLTIYVTLILFICYCARWKHLRDIGLVPMDAACWVSWGEGIKTPHTTGSSWRPLSITYFLSLLLHFEFIGLCFLLLLVSPDVDPVLFVLDLNMKYIVTVALNIRILHGLLSCDSSRICKKCCHVFAHCYTLDDNSEHPMDYDLSLLPNIFLFD